MKIETKGPRKSQDINHTTLIPVPRPTSTRFQDALFYRYRILPQKSVERVGPRDF
jgi:hypothetical protein